MTQKNLSVFSKLAYAEDIASKFGSMDRDRCLDEWRRRFKRPPPKYLSLAFLRKALAFEAQVASNGGHSKRAKKAFRLSTGRSIAATNQKRTSLKSSASSLKAGTQLVREWNGRTYIVEVLDDGFRLDGENYRSLTAIAKMITGAHWSGPRFFGLKS